MNKDLLSFLQKRFPRQGIALDLGAGDEADINEMISLGWGGHGVDIKRGVNLEDPYLSKAGPFDLVYSCFLIHKLKNRATLVATAYDNLKVGGSVFFQTFDHSDEYSSSDLNSDTLRELFKAKGLTDIQTRTFDYYDTEEGHHHWHVVLEVTATKGPQS